MFVRSIEFSIIFDAVKAEWSIVYIEKSEFIIFKNIV